MSHSADTPLGMPAPWLDGKKIVVTGGTGFVGRHLLPQLVAAGARVTCITRATSRRDHLPAGVEVVRADLRSGAGLEEALRGQDICIHMAALLFGLGWQDYLRANSEAARALATAWQRLDAQGQAPQRMVLVSSLAASGPCDTPAGKGDDAPGAPVSAYGWSKLMVEQILGRALGERMVTLRPPIIYGSGDRGLLPVFQGLRYGVAVTPGMFRRFPVSAVHGRDVGRAIICCCRPEAHGVYHVNDGGCYAMADFYRAMARAMGKKACILRLPLCFLGLTALLSTLGGSLLAALDARAAPPTGIWTNTAKPASPAGPATHRACARNSAMPPPSRSTRACKKPWKATGARACCENNHPGTVQVLWRTGHLQQFLAGSGFRRAFVRLRPQRDR